MVLSIKYCQAIIAGTTATEQKDIRGPYIYIGAYGVVVRL